MRIAVPPAFAVVSSTLLIALPLAAQTTIPAGVPLRVQVDHRYRVRAGRHMEGHLIAPIYSVDHKVIPANTRVTGTILGMRPEPQASRTRALLDGQFTPPAVPAVEFNSLILPGGATIPIQTAATERDATVVTMRAGKNKPGLRQQAREIVAERKREAIDTLHHPNLGDRALQWIYAQLPWSPPTIWSGTQYDADLTEPITIPGPVPAPLPQAQIHGIPTGLVEARLTTPLDSATDRHGEPVTAVLTRPLLTPDGKQVLFPQGAEMQGLVTLAQPARWFARNGRLRFTFRNLSVPGAAPTQVHGQLAAAETSTKEKVKITDEGTADSSSGPGKYLAPMALGVMAASAFDGDATSNPAHSGVDSNGFGFAARVLVMTSANATLLHSFAVFALAKSVYYRWIARGHEVRFPRNTRIEILLNER
jgi:hypothetical protein